MRLAAVKETGPGVAMAIERGVIGALPAAASSIEVEDSRMKKQAGFTLVELVVVIIILGILAATALPRFMNIQDDAHSAAVAGAGGGFGSGVGMARAAWVANGGTGAVNDVQDFGANDVNVNANGWPVGTAGTTALVASGTHCAEVWAGVMQNPPSVATTAATADYQATNPNAQECRFIYQADTSMWIDYDAADGSIAITN